MGQIDDFTIKPIKQYSFLLTSFSRHTSSRPSFGGTTLSTVAEAGRGHKLKRLPPNPYCSTEVTSVSH